MSQLSSQYPLFPAQVVNAFPSGARLIYGLSYIVPASTKREKLCIESIQNTTASPIAIICFFA